jgi:hypothetical protein
MKPDTSRCLPQDRRGSRSIFDELLRRLPDMESARPVGRLRSNFIDGIDDMPVKVSPESDSTRVRA